MTTERLLPQADRPTEDVLGRWLLAAGDVCGADVVELAPGLVRTTDGAPSTTTRTRPRDGWTDACADVVVGEAMLTMQTDRGKRAIITEAVRLLRPGGRSAIHELGLTSDDIDDAMADGIRQELVGTIRVNARPLTEAEWRALLTDAGLGVDRVDTAPMVLLRLRRNMAHERVVGTLRIVQNVLRDAAARRRVLAKRKTFTRNADSMTGIALVARLPAKDTR